MPTILLKINFKKPCSSSIHLVIPSSRRSLSSLMWRIIQLHLMLRLMVLLMVKMRITSTAPTSQISRISSTTPTCCTSNTSTTITSTQKKSTTR
uniref:Candidate secreted effector n=1 Tax=Meloidogyne incognita TaxID=6306 RepID=A0A914MH86_MELIC